MVRNNIEVDVKTKCIEQGKTQVQIAEEIDTTKAYFLCFKLLCLRFCSSLQYLSA